MCIILQNPLIWYTLNENAIYISEFCERELRWTLLSRQFLEKMEKQIGLFCGLVRCFMHLIVL